MVDPITIIGAAGAVASTIGVVSKTVKSLRDLRGQWKDADFMTLDLVARLTVLKAALREIQEWINSDPAEQHHQLVMDLGLSLTCCRTLIDKVDAQVSELHRTADDALDLGSKIKAIFRNKASEDLQKVTERQIAALTLLLAVCNCKTISEQQILLEKPSSREVFRRARDDSSSLYVNRDTVSFYSRCTDNLSKLSTASLSYRKLFVSKVYERALRGPFKESIRGRQADVGSTKAPSMFGMTRLELEKQASRSKMIDFALRTDARKLTKILLLGGPESGKENLMRQMKINHCDGYSVGELRMYRDAVRRTVMKTIRTVMKHLTEADIELDNNDMNHVEIIFQEIGKSPPYETEITLAAANAMKSLWDSPKFRSFFFEAVRSGSTYILDSAPYWFDEIQRITQLDYIPTEPDILRVEKRNREIQEYNFAMGVLDIRIFDFNKQQPGGRKFIHQFEDVTTVIYVIDLSSYDQVLLENPSVSVMMEDLAMFDSVVKSRWFTRASFVLFLNNVTRFKQKLAIRPLGHYFPDYSGGNDINRAAEYMLWRSNQVNRANLNLYIHLTEPTDTSNISLVFAAVKEQLLQNAFHDSKSFL